MSFVFLDFDNTLIRGDAGPAFGRHLMRRYRQELRQGGRTRRVFRLGRHWAGLGAFVGWMGVQAALYKAGALRRSTVVRAAYKGLRGVPVDPFYDEMEAFVAKQIPGRIYPAMAEEIRRHQAAGRRCVVVTTGMEPLVRRCLRHLPEGVDLIGCILEERRGRLTGRVRGPLYGADKANIVRAYCRAAGVDLVSCWAYTDHYSDKHMLEAVGHGVCVNPRGRLRDLAAERGWRVMELDDPRS